MWTIFSFFQKIAQILFPESCYGCGKEGYSLCSSCLKTYGRTIETPSLYIVSAYSFKDEHIKRIIHAIKYYHRKDLIKPLVEGLAIEIEKLYSNALRSENWVLFPIPMPKSRKYMRGYNQADIIAEELSKKLSIPIQKEYLARIKTPKRQVKTRTRGQRLKNQYGSFHASSDVKDMRIILVDDVSTTGATLSEARRVLMKAGAKNVRAATLAH